MFAAVGSLVMMPGVLATGRPALTAGCAIYLFSLMAVYAMSTLSHSAASVRWKSRFRQLDQAFIYLLIVATYTPFSLAFLHGPQWDLLLAAMWTVALIGFFEDPLRPPGRNGFGRLVRNARLDADLFDPDAIPSCTGRRFPGDHCRRHVLHGSYVFLVYDEYVKHFHAAWHLCVISGSTTSSWEF